LATKDGNLLLTADAVVAGVHFDLDLVDLDDVGWKALAVNLSDLAAMGGTPGHAVVTVVLPPGTDLERLYEGLGEAADRFGCPIVGGDISAGTELVVAVTVTGTVDGPPVLRSGARPDDGLLVTGPLGASAAGLRGLRSGRASGGQGPAHRRPQPRLEEGRVARRAGATAMIDLSDGLVVDVARLADASGVGIVLDDVPVAPGATPEGGWEHQW
jgi:thiamine-monophosphate kinase